MIQINSQVLVTKKKSKFHGQAGVVRLRCYDNGEFTGDYAVHLDPLPANELLLFKEADLKVLCL